MIVKITLLSWVVSESESSRVRSPQITGQSSKQC